MIERSLPRSLFSLSSLFFSNSKQFSPDSLVSIIPLCPSHSIHPVLPWFSNKSLDTSFVIQDFKHSSLLSLCVIELHGSLSSSSSSLCFISVTFMLLLLINNSFLEAKTFPQFHCKLCVISILKDTSPFIC